MLSVSLSVDEVIELVVSDAEVLFVAIVVLDSGSVTVTVKDRNCGTDSAQYKSIHRTIQSSVSLISNKSFGLTPVRVKDIVRTRTIPGRLAT